MKIRCLIGLHSTTSYSEELGYKNLYEAGELIGEKFSLNSHVDKFLELCAIRCRYCNYQYLAETENRFDLIESLTNPNQSA